MKFDTKTFIAGLMIGGTLFSGITYAAQDQIRLIVNGKEIQGDVAPQIVDGHTLVPIRTVGEALGANVKWNAAQNAVVISNKTTTSESSTSALESESFDVPIQDIQPINSDGSVDIKYDVTDYLQHPQHTVVSVSTQGWSTRSLTFSLDGNYKKLSAVIGLLEKENVLDDSNFEIIADGRSVYQASIRKGMDPKEINVDLTGVKRLTIKSEKSDFNLFNPKLLK